MVERNRESGAASELLDGSDWSGNDESVGDGEIDDTEDDEAVFTDDEQYGRALEADNDDDFAIQRGDTDNPGDLRGESDEFDASDAEFDNIVASYQEPETGNAIETAPSTCQHVEEVVSVQVELEVCLSSP
jgi:hypothetical protein